MVVLTVHRDHFLEYYVRSYEVSVILRDIYAIPRRTRQSSVLTALKNAPGRVGFLMTRG